MPVEQDDFVRDRAGSATAPRLDRALRPKPKWRGVVHEVSFFVYLPLLGGLLFRARSAFDRDLVGVFAVGLLSMLGVSAAYHRGHWTPEVRRLLQRVDHVTILLAMAGTYTAFVGLGVRGNWARVVLTIVWVSTLATIGLRLFWIGVPRKVLAVGYFAVWWPAAAVLPALGSHLSGLEFALLLVGGAIYGAGGVTYNKMWPDPKPGVFGFHEIFHVCVVAGALVHFVAIWLVVDAVR